MPNLEMNPMLRKAILASAQNISALLIKQNPRINKAMLANNILEAVNTTFCGHKVTAALQAAPEYNRAGDTLSLAYFAWTNGEIDDALSMVTTAFSFEDAHELIAAIVRCNDASELAPEALVEPNDPGDPSLEHNEGDDPSSVVEFENNGEENFTEPMNSDADDIAVDNANDFFMPDLEGDGENAQYNDALDETALDDINAEQEYDPYLDADSLALAAEFAGDSQEFPTSKNNSESLIKDEDDEDTEHDEYNRNLDRSVSEAASRFKKTKSAADFGGRVEEINLTPTHAVPNIFEDETEKNEEPGGSLIEGDPKPMLSRAKTTAKYIRLLHKHPDVLAAANKISVSRKPDAHAQAELFLRKAVNILIKPKAR